MARGIPFRKPEDPGEITVVIAGFGERRKRRKIDGEKAREDDDGKLRGLIDPEPENQQRDEGKGRNDPQRLERE